LRSIQGKQLLLI